MLVLDLSKGSTHGNRYCRTHNVSVCLYIAYIACGSASLYIKTLYFFLTALALSAAATVANIKIRYDAKIPQFAIFGTRVIYVFYSIIKDCPKLSRIYSMPLFSRFRMRAANSPHAGSRSHQALHHPTDQTP